jgi:hypothetical protein
MYRWKTIHPQKTKILEEKILEEKILENKICVKKTWEEIAYIS